MTDGRIIFAASWDEDDQLLLLMSDYEYVETVDTGLHVGVIEELWVDKSGCLLLVADRLRNNFIHATFVICPETMSKRRLRWAVRHRVLWQ